MAELVPLERMDRRHVLRAEAGIHNLSNAQLTTVGAGINTLNDVRDQLRCGLLFYCTDQPMFPYIVYYRGQHHLNPTVNGMAHEQAIGRLKDRFHFIPFNHHEPPASIRHGGLQREFQTM